MQHTVHHTRGDRISAVSSQVHTAATTLKNANADLKLVEHPTEKQVASLLHAAVRAATHARALLDAARALHDTYGTPE